MMLCGSKLSMGNTDEADKCILNNIEARFTSKEVEGCAGYRIKKRGGQLEIW